MTMVCGPQMFQTNLGPKRMLIPSRVDHTQRPNFISNVTIQSKDNPFQTTHQSIVQQAQNMDHHVPQHQSQHQPQPQGTQGNMRVQMQHEETRQAVTPGDFPSRKRSLDHLKEDRYLTAHNQNMNTSPGSFPDTRDYLYTSPALASLRDKDTASDPERGRKRQKLMTQDKEDDRTVSNLTHSAHNVMNLMYLTVSGE